MIKYVKIISIALFISACSSNAKYKNVSVPKAVKLIETSTNLAILDVRTSEEYASGNIPNSINIDIMGTDFRSKLNNLDKSKEYLVYCRSGNRATQASKIMSTNGFIKIYNLNDAGYEALVRAILETYK